MKVLIHANCFREGLSFALRVMDPTLEVKTTYNVSSDGARTFMKLVDGWKPDLLLFQEHKLERAEHFLPGKGFAAFVRQARARIPTLSWVHPFNFALWPWSTKTAAELIDQGVQNWKTASRLIPSEVTPLRAQANSLREAQERWSSGRLSFNFKERLEATQAHHRANEERYRPSIVLAPWLEASFQSTRLWWSSSHPTGEVFLEVARRIHEQADIKFAPDRLRRLPGEWVKADHAWPHSAYDHWHFKFAFCTKDLAHAAGSYWRARLREIWPA